MEDKKVIELKLRMSISDAIKRQMQNYAENKLFSDEYIEGMGDASLIAFDPDKHDEENLESQLSN